MKPLTIGVRGTGVYISAQEARRLITPDQARWYARLLEDAADQALAACGCAECTGRSESICGECSARICGSDACLKIHEHGRPL